MARAKGNNRSAARAHYTYRLHSRGVAHIVYSRVIMKIIIIIIIVISFSRYFAISDLTYNQTTSTEQITSGLKLAKNMTPIVISV